MRRKCVLIWCLFLTVPALGQQTKTLTFTGRVIDYNARPVEGATVVCYKSDYELNQRSYERLKQVQTTSYGRFSLQVETKDSSPVLVAGKQGLALGWWSQFGRAIETTIRLGRPSQFKGTVVDQAGRPVSYAKVRICLKNEMMAHQEIAPLLPEGWFTTRTDAKGQFLFDNVPEGATADFGVKATGRASVWTTCDFGPGQGEQFTAGRTDIRIVLPPEASIKGRVVDEHIGQMVAGVRILAIPYSRAGWHFCQDPVKSDPNGRFELTGLAPNKYLLRVISDKEGSGNLTVTVEVGQTVRDVRIPLSKGVPFEVMVYNLENGTPLGDADVTVTQKEAIPRYTTFSQTVSTDANGLARLHVPPGECEVRVFKTGYGGTFQSQSVQLEPGQTLRHEVSLSRSACIISGQVLDGQGQVLPNTLVMYQSWGHVRALTDANGQFMIDNFYVSRLPSRARMLARHIASGLGATGVLHDPTKSGQLRGRIILKPAYELRGRVTDPNGRNIPAASVKLLTLSSTSTVAEVATDPNGVYSIRSVPPEGDSLKYAIVAYAEGFGQTAVKQILFHDDTAQPVQIDPIILLPANEVISGVVMDSNDQPLAGVSVSVYGPEIIRNYRELDYGETLTDSQGRFRITGVCKEPLYIDASSPSAQRLSGQTWANGGSENVKVILGQKLIFSPSLIGKPLPHLKDLKVELPLSDVSGKMHLVCFFDMQQRPSRNCIRELAKRAENLKQKGIIVVAVQASKIDEKALNEWMKKYNIPFTVGMVQGDEEKTKFDWGVRSLPWLILTNREHIVQAEGFTLTEIDEKISAIAQKQN
ncbi:MAG: carboxypeptidase regulatory-like domain-containing protein [Phycisphaerae bacterium]